MTHVARIHLSVTRTLAFRCLCGIAQAPRFWLGVATGVLAMAGGLSTAALVLL
jgi:hypothetical protein